MLGNTAPSSTIDTKETAIKDANNTTDNCLFETTDFFISSYKEYLQINVVVD